ncbi:hypothetical protein [Micrococcus endophyticus]|uniref:hypothetical protein n=1 Tax=Micrococcus endophyticus TaxID=455343 RepID=UPI0034CD9086
MYPTPLTSDVARAGRALAQVGVGAMAAAADLDKGQLRRFEKGLTDLEVDERLRLEKALRTFGVGLVPEDEHGGVGVRRVFTAEKSRRLQVMESEGGPAYHDDI